MNLDYLQLLAEQYPTIQAAATEIIELQSSLYLPKETEHFLSDVHGEYEAFVHLLRSSSGSLRRRIDELLRDQLSKHGRQILTTLIYYPEQKITQMMETEPDMQEWYRITLHRLIQVCRSVASKYPRSEVQSAYPPDKADILGELLRPQEQEPNRRRYYDQIIESIVETGQGSDYIVAFAHLIQRFAISHLHIIGDVFDRGPGAHIIMDTLMEHHSVDFQWGNHDIVWMGAAAGSEACLANVIRVSLRYANTETLENGYGISLLPLASFAMDIYGEDPCTQFMPHSAEDRVQAADVGETEQRLLARMQKAISVIQFKLEGQVIQRRPHYEMEDRLLLDKLDLQQGTVVINGQSYALIDTCFPTLDPADPYALSEREAQVVARLRQSFQTSERLQQHVRFLYAKGGMYKVYNGNLLYHGCISLNADGSLAEWMLAGQPYKGKSYMDRVERLAREGYFATDPERRQYGQDAMWYLWSGARSPLFGKDKMATFERYFVADKTTYKEKQDPYYELRDNVKVIHTILEEFGLDPQTGRIINGHVPVKVRKGQKPLKANGQLIVIDGGLAKAYQQETGIAGYTLISNSYGVLLAEHRPFVSVEKAVREEIDVESHTESISTYPHRLLVKDTDKGRAIERRISSLQQLLEAYRTGLITEK
ncbi:MAG: fructose-1,6-bisphosphatase [Anaerolineales bacterium]|nr:fructose-1,6-bisphosphatase [Anaerolineales bacterium]